MRYPLRQQSATVSAARSTLSAAELAELLQSVAGRPYLAEPVDQLTHALQAAAQARLAAVDDELVLAAALHDIGRAAPVRRDHPGLPHERAGAAFARHRLTERIAWLIEQHVPAKRYLVATDPAYRTRLTPTSQATLARQGGPMSHQEAASFREHLWSADAVRLRRWDDDAKDPQRAGMPIADVLDVFSRWAAAQASHPATAYGRPARNSSLHRRRLHNGER